MDKQTDKIFKYKEKDGKGAGNAVGKMFARNLQSAKITRDKLVFHSLRKYVNNELMKKGVSLEYRCQFIGHELENVNVSVYTNTISVDELAKTVIPALDSIVTILNGPKASTEDFGNLGDLIEGTLI